MPDTVAARLWLLDPPGLEHERARSRRVAWFARDLDLRTPVNVIGCSLGGWVAAEIATVAPQFFEKMILVDTMGIKPERGEIFDYFLEGGLTGLWRAF